MRPIKRVVIVGNGMAGARPVDELLRRDPTLSVTVIGAEEQPAYNRVLLSDVLAGKRQSTDIALPGPRDAVRLLGRRVVAIDRSDRTVTTDDETVLPYDALVLATGSTAIVPPVHGIAGPTGVLLPGVFVFRTLADCAAIADAAGRAQRAIVVGGGLLGLKAARGLLQHGLSVDIVHGMGHLMDVQLDALGGAVLRRAVEALGVGVHLGSFASSVTGSRAVTGVSPTGGMSTATWSCWRAGCARRSRWRPGPGSLSNAASSWTTGSSLTTRTSSRSASARSTAGRSTGWWVRRGSRLPCRQMR